VGDTLQLLVRTSARPQVTFTVNGAPLDLDSGVPTVVATKPDGSVFSPALTASHVGAANSGTYEVAYPAQTEVTRTRLDWTGTIGGLQQTLTTWVEVVGGFLFTIPALRALKVGDGTPFSSSTTFPDTRIHEVRTAVLDEFTQILGFSPVPRFARETLDGTGRGQLLLPHLKAHRLISLTVNGTTQSVSDYTIKPAGILLAASNYVASGTFTGGTANVVAEYAHGWTQVMGDGPNVAMLRAAMSLQPGMSSTATVVSTPDGNTYTFDPAGQITRGGSIRHFGVPAIDSWLNRWEASGLAVA
jgi:hypothetical protein